ncbi:MAG: isoprenylcysteine carboxylmethyltransferase family protein [bacterium]
MNERLRKKHQGREDLVGEYRFGDIGQLILLFMFIVVWVADSFFLKCSTFFSLYIPWYVQIPPAILILFASGYLAQNGLKTVFGEVRAEPEVVDKGVFGLVRHPIYLGAILFYLAMIILTISLFSISIFLVIIVFYNYLARYEEKLLLDKFGSEYEKYMNRVPMWFPGLRKKKN